MATEQEGQKEGEASPHPGLESFHCEVQVIPLPQRPQPVKAAPLVIILQELDTALKDGER